MSENDETAELRKSDLFPNDGNDGGNRETEELSKSDLFPVDDIGLIVSDNLPIDDDSIETALKIMSAEKPIDLGNGLRLEPFIGREGLFIVRNGSSVGRVSDLSPEEKKRIRKYLRSPGKNDLRPAD